MSYSKLKDCWLGLSDCNLNGKKSILIEEYVPIVRLSWPEWKQYIANGNNVLLGSGGVITGRTLQTPYGGG
jgi:hypothetical protein